MCFTIYKCSGDHIEGFYYYLQYDGIKSTRHLLNEIQVPEDLDAS